MTAAWTVAAFDDVVAVYQPETLTVASLDQTGPYEVYGANGVIGNHNRYNHEHSELLLGCRGSVGSVNWSKPRSWINGNAMVVRPRDERIDRRFLYYYLAGGVDLARAISGTAQPQITRESLATLRVPVPPLAEQQRIVAKLDDVEDVLDQLSVNIQRTHAKSTDLMQSVLAGFFRGTHESNQARVAEIATVATGKIDVNRATPNGRFPFFTCSREEFRIDDAPYEGKAILVAGNGDLNVKYFEGRFNAYQRTYFLFCKDERVCLPKYLYWFLESHLGVLRDGASGSTIRYIRRGDLTDARIPLPPLREQESVVEQLDKLRHDIVRLSGSAALRQRRIDDIRSSALGAAFRGDL